MCHSGTGCRSASDLMKCATLYLAYNILITSSLAVVFLFNFLQQQQDNGRKIPTMADFLAALPHSTKGNEMRREGGGA